MNDTICELHRLRSIARQHGLAYIAAVLDRLIEQQALDHVQENP